MLLGGLAHNGSVILCPFVQFMSFCNLAHAQWNRIRHTSETYGGGNGDTDEKSGFQ